MKYAIIKVVNDNFFIHAEGFTSLESTIPQYHGLCQTLWNAPDVINATVKIVDTNLVCVEGYVEFIKHPVTES